MKLKWFGPGKRGGVGPRTWEAWGAIAFLVLGVAATLGWLRPWLAEITGIDWRIVTILLIPPWIGIFFAIVWFTYDAEG